jgi:hypothetical protein
MTFRYNLLPLASPDSRSASPVLGLLLQYRAWRRARRLARLCRLDAIPVGAALCRERAAKRPRHQQQLHQTTSNSRPLAHRSAITAASPTRHHPSAPWPARSSHVKPFEEMGTAGSALKIQRRPRGASRHKAAPEARDMHLVAAIRHPSPTPSPQSMMLASPTPRS